MICTKRLRGFRRLSSSNRRSFGCVKKDEMKKVVFSGIQPTGDAPHVGNYLGAMKRWVELQDDEEAERLYSIVDLHALTTIGPNTNLRNQTREMTAALLACGICPSRSIVYAQSDVVYHAELSWILSCVTPINHLQRMTQYKEKKEKSPNLGLFAYPVLQAADILLYRATHVPVGEDQAQHLELSRTIARSFNNFAGHKNLLIPPTAMISKQSETSRVQSLRDATKKMSKSDPSDMSRINLTDDADTIAKKVRKAKTDSEPGLSFDTNFRPGVSNLIAMYASFRDLSVEHAMKEVQPQNMGGLKAALTEVLVEKVCPIGDKMRDLLSDCDYLDRILDEGGNRAREKAEKTMRDVRGALKL